MGIDLVEVKRFAEFDFNSKAAENLFSKKELIECRKKQKPDESIAARFAAKESLRKCIKENLKYNQLEVLNLENGEPVVNILDPKIKNKYECILSLTHTAKLAEAVCICINKKPYG